MLPGPWHAAEVSQEVHHGLCFSRTGTRLIFLEMLGSLLHGETLHLQLGKACLQLMPPCLHFIGFLCKWSVKTVLYWIFYILFWKKSIISVATFKNTCNIPLFPDETSLPCFLPTLLNERLADTILWAAKHTEISNSSIQLLFLKLHRLALATLIIAFVVIP